MEGFNTNLYVSAYIRQMFAYLIWPQIGNLETIVPYRPQGTKTIVIAGHG